MEIILLERVGKLGTVGDVVKVKDGYARNFLIPEKKALRATKENKQLFETQKAQIEEENSKKRQAAEAVATKLTGTIVTLIRQAGEDGRLFGSVNARDIALAVQEQGIEVNRNQVVLSDPIKNMGIFAVTISLHSEVNVSIHVNVARSEAEAEDAKKEFLNPSEKKKAAAKKAKSPKAEEGGEVNEENDAAA